MPRVQQDAFTSLVLRALNKARDIAKHPDATNELSFRPAVNTLLSGLPAALAMPSVSEVVLTEPKRKAYGAPDYKVFTTKQWLIGYIEAKGIYDDVRRHAETEQIKRYRAAGQRLLLTNLLDFGLFDYDVNDVSRPIVPVAWVHLLSRDELQNGAVPDATKLTELQNLLRRFLRDARPDIRTPKELAVRLAESARQTAELLLTAIVKGPKRGPLPTLKQAIETMLIPELTDRDFTDMYAQTITYGLFAGAWNHDPARGPFGLATAWRDIPRTNPFLRTLFESLTGSALEEQPYLWVIEDLAAVLAALDLNTLLADFGRHTKALDPVIHFYEDFLVAYNPRLRELRGVYYTPEPVVAFIVRAIDDLLKSQFALPDGLADTSTIEVERDGRRERISKILILDPATGTGTFLYHVVNLIRDEFAQSAGDWSDYVRQYLLPRIFGFELLMAPYAVAHLKLGLQLAARDLDEPWKSSLRFDFQGDERVNVFLTNTLEEPRKQAEALFGILGAISHEANLAAEVKRDLPIMVILGNPPYSSSMFEGEWIISLMETYKQNLKERKFDLNREEWKFLRFAQWRVEKTNAGIVGFVINNTFLDGVTQRIMRESLMSTFSEIYFLNLHGSVKARTTRRFGEIDENVFDIEQGVTIAIFVRREGTIDKAKVYYSELHGDREHKYERLYGVPIEGIDWNELHPTEPYFFFVPRLEIVDSEYNSFPQINKTFKKYSSGIQTKKDRLTVGFTHDEVWDRVRDFSSLETEAARSKYALGKDGGGWKVSPAQKDVRESGPRPALIHQMLYRPFDIRFTYYTGRTSGFMGRPRRDLMQHMLSGPNIGLIGMRQTVDAEFSHVGVTRLINCHGTFYLGNRGQDYLFPLYLYEPRDQSDAGQLGMFSEAAPNLSSDFIALIEMKTGLRFQTSGCGDLTSTVGSEDVLHYLYAVLHAPTYRERYAELLRSDFPRVPITADRQLFVTLCQKGADLVGLHLLEDDYAAASWMQTAGVIASPLRRGLARFPVGGSNLVEEVEFASYDEATSSQPEGRVYINGRRTAPDRQYFEGVPVETWTFQVGGYRVCEKWLKDRHGRTLSFDERRHYARLVAALRETIRLMNEIDAAVPSWPLT